jgi:NTE family protein
MAAGTRVALALGSGGARGYAHIGVIQELESRGFEIVGIAGTSMGALVGGLFAAKQLEPYTDWAVSLTQRDVLRLLDPTLTGPGMLRADKVITKVTELIGDVHIEDLAIPFTAVASDLTARKEIWFQRGRLDAAIRASIAIPGVITPVVMNGRLLADGGLMNPVPVVATAAIPADVTVAVSLAEEQVTRLGWPDVDANEPAGTFTEADEDESASAWTDHEFVRTLTTWLDNIRGQVIDEGPPDPDPTDHRKPFDRPPAGLRTRDVLDLALDTLRSVVAKYRLAGYPPDVLITIPQDACGTMDFHRAREIIEVGRERTRQTLDLG